MTAPESLPDCLIVGHYSYRSDAVDVAGNLTILLPDTAADTVEFQTTTSHEYTGDDGTKHAIESMVSVNLADVDVERVHAYLGDILAQRKAAEQARKAAEQARFDALPTYRARYLSEPLTGDNRIGVFDELNRMITATRQAPGSRTGGLDNSPAILLGGVGYVIVGESEGPFDRDDARFHYLVKAIQA